jgi:hypothetical protein
MASIGTMRLVIQFVNSDLTALDRIQSRARFGREADELEASASQSCGESPNSNGDSLFPSRLSGIHQGGTKGVGFRTQVQATDGSKAAENQDNQHAKND